MHRPLLRDAVPDHVRLYTRLLRAIYKVQRILPPGRRWQGGRAWQGRVGQNITKAAGGMGMLGVKHDRSHTFLVAMCHFKLMLVVLYLLTTRR